MSELLKKPYKISLWEEEQVSLNDFFDEFKI